MLRHRSLHGLLLGSKRANGQFQRSPSLARLYAQGRARAIQTLDPSKLQPSDYVRLAGMKPRCFARDSAFELGYKRLPHLVPFPENAFGFLYLSSSAGKPQSAWEIRFRVTDSNSRSSFQSGTDLLCPDRKPWHIPLRSLGYKKYAALWGLLLRDGMVDDALFHVRPFGVKQHIQTIDRSRLHPSDHLNLSGSPEIRIYAQDAAFTVSYTEVNRRLSFPDDTRGFLYWHAPAAESKAMWEIRFRVTDNNCASSFQSGSDLVYPNGTTWAISLGSLHPHNREYLPLRDLLIHEGVDVDALLDMVEVTKVKMATSRPLINSLAKPFRVDFKSISINVIFISFSGEQMHYAMKSMFGIGQTLKHRLSPYSGSAWCRFEAHSSPGSTQPDQLAIRVIEMITPVTVSNPEFAHRIPVPQEGKLVMKYTRYGPNNGIQQRQPKTLDPRPWTLSAQATAHPVIQAILRGTDADATA